MLIFADLAAAIFRYIGRPWIPYVFHNAIDYRNLINL